MSVGFCKFLTFTNFIVYNKNVARDEMWHESESEAGGEPEQWMMYIRLRRGPRYNRGVCINACENKMIGFHFH